ncbi:uncharacterized protein ACNLHF_026506 [Anomaloglossus baeobatrachus]|uniref:uncharacterized protein LOC142245711 n=1 Tax=Anomaloglossus baeobatrachus TaxID=238106 RepID=UPI003F503AFE
MQLSSQVQRTLKTLGFDTLRISCRGPRYSRVMVLSSNLVVGIFSREDSSTYDWLIRLLLSADFRSVVGDVRPVAITNTVCGGSWRLADEIDKCTFAILYHSKKRGRLNITDVTDALYNEELRDLSARLGREKVLVLVDDLDDGDDGAHGRITQEQHSISRLAGLMVVFYVNSKPVRGGSSGQYQRDEDPRVSRNIERMRSQMSSGSGFSSALRTGGERINWAYCLPVAGGAVLLIILVIVLCVELVPR